MIRRGKVTGLLWAQRKEGRDGWDPWMDGGMDKGMDGWMESMDGWMEKGMSGIH